TKIQTVTVRPAFAYTPGDHRRYVWNGGLTAAVERIVITDWGNGVHEVTFTPTGDWIPMEGVARTASAFMDAVDRWRADR
ncbi:MAG TPA: hypothetical protein VIV15_14925, partial [Anaerolineales bacterium]